jgi:hypothetical protein
MNGDIIHIQDNIYTSGVRGLLDKRAFSHYNIQWVIMAFFEDNKDKAFVIRYLERNDIPYTCVNDHNDIDETLETMRKNIHKNILIACSYGISKCSIILLLYLNKDIEWLLTYEKKQLFVITKEDRMRYFKK